MERTNYNVFRIPKRSGGFREILEPKPELKTRQRSVLAWLMARRIAPSPYAHAFVLRRSIATNARPHVGKRVVVRIDVKDFFPSISEGQVAQALVREGLPGGAAREIADLCTAEGRLPQGAPTSPFLSNVVFKPLDHRLAGLAGRWSQRGTPVAFTRYADDLTFSGNDPRLNQIIHPVRSILNEAGFAVNREKTRVYRSSNRQTVTGIVVNRVANVDRRIRHRLRGILHRLKVMLIENKTPTVNLPRLQGHIAHIASINPDSARPLKSEFRTVRILVENASCRGRAVLAAASGDC